MWSTRTLLMTGRLYMLHNLVSREPAVQIVLTYKHCQHMKKYKGSREGPLSWCEHWKDTDTPYEICYVQRCKLLSGSRGSESNKPQVGKNGRQAPAGTFGAVSSRRSRQRPDDMDVHTQSSSYCLGGDETRHESSRLQVRVPRNKATLSGIL